ncbi:MAG TPA: DoxX family protein [Burkholderiales bacterium]|nr:DoxX family protein [Burkholderiales bacterium]
MNLSGFAKVMAQAVRAIAFLSPLFDLVIRVYVAKAFFLSGLTKIMSWSSTLSLFENEYAVPLLPPELAAYLGTAAELVLPPLLVLGIGGRAVALAAFIFNLVAATSYPDISEAGIKDHVLWGALLAVTFFHGPGKLSLDYLILRRFRRTHGRRIGEF